MRRQTLVGSEENEELQQVRCFKMIILTKTREIRNSNTQRDMSQKNRESRRHLNHTLKPEISGSLTILGDPLEKKWRTTCHCTGLLGVGVDTACVAAPRRAHTGG